MSGQALYTSAFTPPTSNLTAVPGTQLLTLQDNRFKDNSVNAIPLLTLSVAPTIQAISPWEPASSWSASANGGSMYFNGTTDYLNLPASPIFNIGTNDFTIEAWVYPIAYGATVAGASLLQTNTGAVTGYALNLGESKTRCRFISNGTGAWADNVVAAVGPDLNCWSHVSVVRSGTNLSIYINGTLQGTTAIASSFTLNGSSAQATVGYYNEGTNIRFLNGYISNLRIVNGSSVYLSLIHI